MTGFPSRFLLVAALLVIAASVSADDPAAAKKPSAKAERARIITVVRQAVSRMAKASLPGPLRDTILETIGKESRRGCWSDSWEDRLFGVAVRRLPSKRLRKRATPIVLSSAQARAANEMLLTRAVADAFAGTGLTDRNALREAILRTSGKLQVVGKIKGGFYRSVVEGDFAVGLTVATKNQVEAYLLQPAVQKPIQGEYREVLHARMKRRIKEKQWQSALELWKHLRRQSLISPGLFLDAVRCLRETGQGRKAVRVLDEALKEFQNEVSVSFFERVGDVALEIGGEHAERVAASAYTTAIARLSSRVTR